MSIPLRSVSSLVGLTLILAACSQHAAPANPSAGEVGFPWEASSSALASLSLTNDVNTLQYETPISATNSWGPIEKNASNGEQAAGDGHPITLNGRRSSQGYGVHASSELRFSLKGSGGAQCRLFTADVGVDDEVGGLGSVTFQVFADGVKLFDSGRMTGSSATKQVNVGVAGRQELRLVVTDAGDGISNDHADWADPKVTCTPARPTSGSLDPSFHRTPLTGFHSSAVVLPDGKVVRRGESTLERLNPDGSVDPTFGQNGSVSIPAESFFFDRVVRQPDGKLLVHFASTTLNSLRRYLPDGQPDASFGQGGAINPGFGVRFVAVQPDGRILIGGDTDQISSRWFVQRLHSNGAVDVTFGVNGTATTTIGGAAPGVSLQLAAVGPDGKITVVGSALFQQAGGGANPYQQFQLALARYNPDGTPDTTFSGDGQRVDAIVTTSQDYDNAAEGLTVQPDGKVLVGGVARGESTVASERFDGAFIARYGVDGARDTHFGTNGAVLFSNQAASPASVISGVAVQGDGKVLVSGFWSSGNNPYTSFVKRLNANGTVDPSFNTAAASASDGSAINVLPDGRLLFGTTQLVRVWP